MSSEFIDFTVRIKKEGVKSGLIGEFLYLQGEFNISNVTFSEDIDNDLVHLGNSKRYVGPEFNTLDELFQKRFGIFFEDLGINQELANFLIMLSTDKDERLYHDWLNKIRNFI